MESTYSLRLDESGALKIEGDESDYLILPASTVSKIGKRLYKIVGDAANVQLMEIGRSVGQSLAELIKRQMKGSDNMSVLDSIDLYFKKSGFGVARVEDKGDHYEVIIENPPSLRYKEEGIKKCRFEAGLIKGVLEEITGKKWQVNVNDKINEGKCVIYVRPVA